MPTSLRNQQIIALWNRGRTIRDVMEEMSLSKAIVATIIWRARKTQEVRKKRDDDRTRRIIDRIQSGIAKKIIAQEFGITRQRVSQIALRTVGHVRIPSLHRPKHEDSFRETILCDWNTSNASYGELAKKHGISRYAVSGILTRARKSGRAVASTAWMHRLPRRAA